MFINLVSCGTTPNIKEIIIGRCYDFQETQSNGKNPLLSVDVDCEELWEVFNNTIAYQDPCNITVETYEELFDIMNNGVHIRDKVMENIFYENIVIIPAIWEFCSMLIDHVVG